MILYFGNKKSVNRPNPTTIDNLSDDLHKLLDETIITSSEKDIKLFRLLDMVYTFLKNYKSARLILIDTYSTKNFWYCVTISVLSIFYKKNYILILHGGAFKNRLINNNKLTNYIFKKAIRIVSPSKILIEEIKPYINDNLNIIYIPNYIKNNFDSTLAIKKINLPDIKIVFFRALANIYRPHDAIHFCKELHLLGYKASLEFAGPDKENLEKELTSLSYTLGISSFITFKGYIDKNKVDKYLANFNILINPTSVDNFPVSVLEAMAAGLLVVNTSVGFLKTLIKDGENGILYPVGDISQAAQKLDKIIQSEGVHSVLMKSIETSSLYRWNSIAPKWLSILNKH